MTPSRRLPLRHLALLAMAAWTLSGCTANFRMPWEDNPLDPSRIVTREPLEIPPNLSQLPPTAQPEVEPKDKTAPVAAAPTSESASAILFDTPAPAAKAAAPDRNENAPLPDWMSSPGSATAAKSAAPRAIPKAPPDSIVNPKDKSAEAEKKSALKGRNAMTR